MSILQGSTEWLEAKQSKISASEIYSLVHHYCKSELEKLGFHLVKERPFRTVQEMFLKVKFGAKLSEIDPIHSEFGNGMEPYVAYRLGQQLPQLQIERSKEFLVNEKVHRLAACSPDGYIRIKRENIGLSSNPHFGDSYQLSDFDNTCVIDNKWGRGALELKTANYFANFDQGGPKGQYLFQLQYQMMVMGLNWGCLAVLMPKQKEFDEPFFKGKRLKEVEIANLGNFSISGLEQYYDLKHYIYPELPAFKALILKALLNFQNDLDGYEQGNQSCFPRNSEDLVGLQREKQLWAQLWPEHFGTHLVDEKDELNDLLNERYKYQEALMFAEQDKLKTENEISDLVKRCGLGKFCELKGTDHRMTWIKNGQVRFYRNNNKIT